MADLPTGTVTFLFTDIEGSTRLLGELGEDSKRVFDRHLELITRAVVGCGGSVVRTEGDSVFAVFASALAAASAAVGAQRALQWEEWGTDHVPWVRMGLHTGEAVASSGDYHGVEVHRAARIGDAGSGGQVLVSHTTTVLIGDSLPPGTHLRDLDFHRLRDLAEPERLHQLCIEGLRTEFPPLRTLDVIPNNLPMQLTSFVGRPEVDRVIELLREHRLLTLTGPGGTGKTRLALHAAAEAADDYDGVYWVPLAPVTDPELVASTAVTALGLSHSADDPVARLMAYLAPRRWLLLLDNFEQVLGAAPVVADLLAGAADLSVLVTSRAPLHISGEQEYPVPPLDVPAVPGRMHPEQLAEVESVHLFVERARAALPSFTLDDSNAVAVAQIVARLDGLPLAIELAAARVKLLPPHALMKRLTDSLGLLVGGRRDLPERQQTLRGAISWSYEMLDPVARSVFERVSVFFGGATLEAVETLCPDATLDRIEMLADHSLLRLEEVDGEPRLSMLETIREFAAACLERSSAGVDTRDRHLRIYLELAEEAAPRLVGFEQPVWLDRLAMELDNLRAAMTWAMSSDQPDMAARLLFALWRFWHMRGPLSEGWERAEAVLAMPGLAGTDRLRVLEAAGGIGYWRGDFERSVHRYQAALDLAEQMDEPAEVANALYNLAFTRQGTSASAEMVEKSLALYREIGDRDGVAKALWGLGTAYITQEEYQRGVDVLSEALGVHSQSNDAFHLGWTHRMTAVGLLSLGRGEEAFPHIEAALEIFGAARDMSGVVLLLRDIAELEVQRGDIERAVILRAAVRAHQKELGLDLVDAYTAHRMTGVDAAAAGLAPDRLAELEGRGATMTIDESIAFALSTERDPVTP